MGLIFDCLKRIAGERNRNTNDLIAQMHEMDVFDYPHDGEPQIPQDTETRKRVAETMRRMR
jgi:hypothetical protein